MTLGFFHTRATVILLFYGEDERQLYRYQDREKTSNR
jgi:hypothetical protein